ncbi:MAG: hypothetical protein ACO1Q7_12480 [Gemmatimonas sp.]
MVKVSSKTPKVQPLVLEDVHLTDDLFPAASQPPVRRFPETDLRETWFMQPTQEEYLSHLQDSAKGSIAIRTEWKLELSADREHSEIAGVELRQARHMKRDNGRWDDRSEEVDFAFFYDRREFEEWAVSIERLIAAYRQLPENRK